jgi:hypothetical protein
MEIIKITYDGRNDSISKLYEYCTNLNKILSNIKLCHLFTKNYNTHIIYGNLYDELSDLFDKLQEELIGLHNVVNSTPFPFIEFVPAGVDYDSTDWMDVFKQTINNLYALLLDDSFVEYLSTLSKNGINNTIDEIYSKINRADYLLNMAVIKLVQEPVVDSGDSVIQTNIESDYPIQTFLTPQV